MNAAPKFTPGPWIADSDPRHTIVKCIWRDAPGESQSEVARAYNDANARLIAAAPELYEALRKIVASLEFGELDATDPLADEARAALAKVTA